MIDEYVKPLRSSGDEGELSLSPSWSPIQPWYMTIDDQDGINKYLGQDDPQIERMETKSSSLSRRAILQEPLGSEIPSAISG
ncbi:hypothetical protein K443DRAFT_676589 [Laccaria amethystina LaAM-08-1]|uniref:Uncharacterized protein n=1 Tax=Laccaria amethystina LaAM-08-1 TaxID=1095629 RepID=A0A0C9WVN2_9AGAR|nr:hypothetical protein K443DRAFT_676589 [Laccaria amethystina LaAM-08-1]